MITADGTRVITEYVYGQKFRQTGDFEYENADGMKFRVFVFDASEAANSRAWLSTYAKRRSIVKNVKWLGVALDVYPDENYPGLYIITKKKESSLCVGAWNLFPDKIDHMRLKIEKELKDVHFINCIGRTEKDAVVLDKVLYPYEFAGLKINL